MELTILQEKEIRLDSARLGAEIALKKLGLIKDDISQREAFRIWGEAIVRSWCNSGLVKRVSGDFKNSKKTYSRIELETVHSLILNRKIKNTIA